MSSYYSGAVASVKDFGSGFTDSVVRGYHGSINSNDTFGDTLLKGIQGSPVGPEVAGGAKLLGVAAVSLKGVVMV